MKRLVVLATSVLSALLLISPVLLARRCPVEC